MFWSIEQIEMLAYKHQCGLLPLNKLWKPKDPNQAMLYLGSWWFPKVSHLHMPGGLPFFPLLYTFSHTQLSLEELVPKRGKDKRKWMLFSPHTFIKCKNKGGFWPLLNDTSLVPAFISRVPISTASLWVERPLTNTVLGEDLSSVPRTHVGWLMTTYN